MEGTNFYIFTQKPPTLEEARGLIGGHIEILHLNGNQFLFDEDGIGKGLTKNLEAQRIMGIEIRGNVVQLKGGAKW